MGKLVNRVLALSYKKCKSPYQILRKAVHCKQLANYIQYEREKYDKDDENQSEVNLHAHNEKELQFYGIMIVHQLNCTDPDCFCKNRKKIYDHQLRKFGDPNSTHVLSCLPTLLVPIYEDIVSIKFRIKQFFAEGLKKFPDDVNLIIHFSLYYASQLKAIHMAYMVLITTNAFGTTFLDRFFIFQAQ